MATVTYDHITIRFKEDEIWELALALKDKLEDSLTSEHYDRYPDSWKSNTGLTVALFKTICLSTRRLHLITEMETKIAERFKVKEVEPCEP